MAFLEEHPEVQAETEALTSYERHRSFAGRMIFNNVYDSEVIPALNGKRKSALWAAFLLSAGNPRACIGQRTACFIEMAGAPSAPISDPGALPCHYLLEY